jgi:quinol monooxygenase YgiN
MRLQGRATGPRGGDKVITATAIQRVRQGKEAELIQLMKYLTAKVKSNEPGCTIFIYVRSTEKPRTYLVVEQYVDQKAFDAHHATAYLEAFIPKMMTCLEEAPAIETYADVLPAPSP